MTRPRSRAMLADAGLRPTRQREAIIAALGRTARPITAQALHERLARRADAPGLATVYRTLQALATEGLVRTFPAGEGELAYKLCDPGHHHHLICEVCGTVIEIPACEVEGWASSVAAPRGFVVTAHQADIYGRCASCRRGHPARRQGVT